MGNTTTLTISNDDLQRILDALEEQREAYQCAISDETEYGNDEAAAEAEAEYDAHDELIARLLAVLAK